MTKNDDDLDGASFSVGIVVGGIIMCCIFGLSGAFNSPLSELDIDTHTLAKEYVIQEYPEYKDCNFKYYEGDFLSSEQVSIYCDVLENRDGLKMKTDGVGYTAIIYFDTINLEEIAKAKLEVGL